MNSNKIVNVTTPTAAQDAATKSYVDTSIPVGGIIMWSGTIASIPSNWRLCNGAYGTPNLTNRFIIGADTDTTTIHTGGSGGITKAHTYIEETWLVTGGTKDAVVVSHNHSGYTNSNVADGGHNHTTAGLAGFYRNASDASPFVTTGYQQLWTAGNGTDGYRYGGGTNYTVSSTSSEHTHRISSDGVAGTNKNLPPYFALAFIMRIS